MIILDQIMQFLLEKGYYITKDYGIAIILVTIIIRSILLPVDILQKKKEKKTRIMSERAEKIKREFQHNPKKMEVELQKLYQENTGSMGMCLIVLLQFPIMISLYRVIRKVCSIAGVSVLLPWVSSLIVKDQLFVLPLATIAMQLLPQTYPYLRLFNDLGIQKSSPKMVITMILMSSVYLFAMPSGVGLYCFVSALYQAVEQFTLNVFMIRTKTIMA